MFRTTALVAFLLISINILGQTYYSDSALVSGSSTYIKKYYYSTRNEFAPLYRGTVHYSYPADLIGIPYYLNYEWQIGKVIYEDELYENISMKYDQVKDQLIVLNNRESKIPLELFSPRVKEFSFNEVFFKYINKQNPYSLKEGFYQVLDSGMITALGRTEKVINEEIEGDHIVKKIAEFKRYYAIKENKLFAIKTKKDLFNIIKEHRKEVLGKLKSRKLRFKKNQESVITAAVNNYNRLEEN